MSSTRRIRLLVSASLVIALAACGSTPGPTSAPAAPGSTAVPAVDVSAQPSPATAPGHELFGFLPYWEMDDEGITQHVAGTPLSTLALFSVTHTAKGAINTNQRGYRLINGEVGRRLIREAQERGTRVELVYTSFGGPRNRKLLEGDELQAKVIESLVALASDLGVDGINVDIEALDPTLVPDFGGFIADLRAAVLAEDPGDTVSVATGAHALGAAMAVAAGSANVDRIFMMGYDYRTGRSDPGATAPLDRSDGGVQSLRRSLDLYAALGVPADRLLLGLPLYGVEWPVAGPVIGAPSTGRGEAWFPRSHVDLLADPSITPVRDEIEQVEVYLLGSDGTVGTPPPGASATAGSSGSEPTWQGVYVDSPETLAPKMALANERGLAGAGFWAIGYERGLPGYTRLMERFTAGDPLP